MYQTLEFWIISENNEFQLIGENKIETCGEIGIKWGDAVF